MKPSVYIETTIIGYLASRLSRDLITAAHQQLTQEWWDRHRQKFDLYISELVVQEVGAGAPEKAKKRGDALANIPQLELNEPARRVRRPEEIS